MAELTLQQIIAAGRRAEAGGDMAAANRFRTAAQRIIQSKNTAESNPPAPSALESYANFGRGITQGFRNTTQKGEEWLYRGIRRFGDEDLGDDMLTALNRKRMRQDTQNEYYFKQSPLASSIGKVVGETAALMPIGGIAGGGARAVVGANNLMARGAVVATEGAAVGAYMSDADKVASGAAVGAATDVAVSSIFSPVSRFAGSTVRAFRNRGRAKANVNEATSVIGGRVDEAANYGGYELDSANALGTRQATRDYQDLRNSDEFGGEILNFEDRQNRAIMDRGEELIQQYGPRRGQNQYTLSDDVRVILRDLRQADHNDFKRLYKEFDDLAAQGNTRLDPIGLGVQLQGLRSEFGGGATLSLVKKIEGDLKRYGLLTEKPRYKGGEVINAPKAEPGKELSLENVENLIQDINSYWSHNLSDGKQRVLHTYKNALEKYVDDILEKTSGSSEVVEAARAARQARSQFSDNWTTNQIVDKMSDVNPDGSFKVDYTLALNKLSANDVTRLKARLLDKPEALRSMQQAPLIEALADATHRGSNKATESGDVVFNINAFERVINRIDPRTQEALWGKDGAETIHRTIEAWKLRTRVSANPGTLNPSGTAFEILRQIRFLPTGRTRNVGMAVSGLAPSIRNAATRGNRRQATMDVMGGEKLPDATEEAMIWDELQRFESEFTGANGQVYGDILRQFVRTASAAGAVQFSQQ